MGMGAGAFRRGEWIRLWVGGLWSYRGSGYRVLRYSLVAMRDG